MTLTRAQYREAWQAGVRPGNHILPEADLIIWSKVRASTLLTMLRDHEAIRPIIEAAMYDYEANHDERMTE